MKKVRIEKIQKVKQEKFVRQGWSGRLVLHEKCGGKLSASGDHKQLFYGMRVQPGSTSSYVGIAYPSSAVTQKVFERLEDPRFGIVV